MNSYPPELLVQLAPVMFVAGLDPPQQSQSPDPEGPSKPDPLQVLTARLRDALANQRKVAIWQSEKSKTFQVILVDKDVRFPPRKLVPPDDISYSTAHSPLSPLTPSSPLHPDGLIAPIWIRKHTTLIPSVLVVFMRIFELPPHIVRNPEEVQDSERERAEEEKRRDAELAAEISYRKKGTNERGVKLTVVLMASRRLLDDPRLDTRLAFIRRQSGLDSRAALFVLSPVSAAELGDFVQSLQQALYDPALEYYTAHSKRVRRKRNRHSQATSTYTNPAIVLANPNIARPLRPEGWTVRYEYKMACFAEFRGEDEVALKHYQDAYSALIIMFGSTAILPPRTKRWAEAKVLADCINIKIVKLYLYNNEHALALSHHNTHLRQFNDLSRGWGIGEETYEFWGWVARQYRVLGELIDQGTRTGLTIPVHKPISASQTAAQAAARNMGMPELDVRSLGVNPSHALHHSGYYYFMAAKATELRRERFVVALEAENNNNPIAISPGFINEKKVDHLSLILELYTKAYELFKKYSSPQGQAPGRLTLWIAYQIADVYSMSGKHDMAVKFLERIAKTYRKEGWYPILKPLLSKWYHCAQQMGDVNTTLKLLLEMLAHDLGKDEESTTLQEDLVAVLQSTVPSTEGEVLVCDAEEALPIFETSAVFWDAKANVSQPASFQLSITSPPQVAIASLPVVSLEIYLSGVESPLIVQHEDPEPEDVGSLRRIDVGNIATGMEIPVNASGNLRWGLDSTTLFTGTITAAKPIRLEVENLVMNLELNKWKIRLPLAVNASHKKSPPRPRWLCSLDPVRFINVHRADPSFTIIKHRPHMVRVRMEQLTPAYLDEDFELEVQVTNHDEKELDIVVDVLLQPSDIDYAVNSISVDGQVSTGLIKDVRLGTLLPGASQSKIFHSMNAGAIGDRILDVSVTSSASREGDGNASESEGEEQDEPGSPTDLDKTAHQITVTIPVVSPFEVIDNIAYARSSQEWPAVTDLVGFQHDFPESQIQQRASIELQFKCAGPWGIYIESVAIEIEKGHSRVKLLDSSVELDDSNLFPSEYLSGDEFSLSCRLGISQTDDVSSNELPIPSPGRFVLSWRRILPDGSYGKLSKTLAPLPILQPTTDDLVALVDIGPTATLHVPMPMTIIVRNNHPQRSADIAVQLEPDMMDGFVVAGLRAGRVPVLLPGVEERLTWSLIPLECGYARIPRIRVFDRRKAKQNAVPSEVPNPDTSIGEPVKVVDLRRDRRHRVSIQGEEGDDTIDHDPGTEFGIVLVLPPGQ